MEELKSRNELLDIIGDVSRSEGLKDHEIADVKTNAKGEGYLGQIFFVTVKDKVAKKDLNLILKCAFKDEKVREFAPIRTAFENEVRFYSTVHPGLKEFGESHDLERTLDVVAKCYAVSLQDHAEIVVLENLRPLGFETFDKVKVLDHDHVKLIFETYGRYHAYSFALRDQNPEEFYRLGGGYNDVLGDFSKNEPSLQMFESFVLMIREFFVPGEDDEVLRRLKNYETGEKIGGIFKSSTSSDCEHPIIIHGDCWSNNMMFKYEEIDGTRKVKDIRLIDWQLPKIASPACDLSYFLYSGASKEIFDKLDDYLKIYHDTLSSYIRQLGSNPEELYPFSALKSDWRLYAKYGIIMSIMILKLKMTYKDEMVDMVDFGAAGDNDKAQEVFLSAGYDKESYKKRMVDLLRHTVEVDAL